MQLGWRTTKTGGGRVLARQMRMMGIGSRKDKKKNFIFQLLPERLFNFTPSLTSSVPISVLDPNQSSVCIVPSPCCLIHGCFHVSASWLCWLCIFCLLLPSLDFCIFWRTIISLDCNLFLPPFFLHFMILSPVPVKTSRIEEIKIFPRVAVLKKQVFIILLKLILVTFKH